jgi:hypothetical protein
MVSFDMEDAICPVNPLEDKFLIAYTNIILEDNLNIEFMHMIYI